jgi:outer membrane lipoprotein-sorting protein
MKVCQFVFKSCFFFYSFACLAVSEAEQWVKKADEIRNPSESYSMLINVVSDDQTSQFEVFLKGQEKTMIVTKEPARDKGRNMLMLDRDFHAYVPNLKRSMRLSLAQKLSGQVANGDISRTRWFGDYAVAMEKDDKKTVQLFLTAKKENLTYAAVRLWIEKSKNHPLRAEYLGSNGKTVLKSAYFESYKSLAGRLRPSVIRIADTAQKISRIEIVEMKNKDLSDSFFTVRRMESYK